MFTEDQLRLAWRLGCKGFRFKDVLSLLEEEEEDDMPSTISVIFKKVCNYYGTHPNRVVSKSRRIEYVKSRMMFSYICCNDYQLNQTDVARIIGKDRSTLVHYNHKIQGFLDIDDVETCRDVKNIREMLIK